MPKVSVILCAYKSKKNILPTIDSILKQTFTDFELIIIDDASNDGTSEVINAVDDSRIRIITNKKNIGVVNSRNIGLKLATGQYIAHCDHDDIWKTEKLEEQLSVMNSNPTVGLCGTEINVYVNGQFQETTKMSSYSSKYLKWNLFQNSTFLHSSTMVRASVIKKYGISYRKGLNFADDWCIYHQYAKVSDIMKLSKALTNYHLHGRNWSIIASDMMDNNGGLFLCEEINLLTGCEYNRQMGKDYFSAIVLGRPCINAETLLKVGKVMYKIYGSFCKKNDPSKDEISIIKKNISEQWWRIVSATARMQGFRVLQIFNMADTPHWIKPNKFIFFKTVLKIFINKIIVLKANKK